MLHHSYGYLMWPAERETQREKDGQREAPPPASMTTLSFAAGKLLGLTEFPGT